MGGTLRELSQAHPTSWPNLVRLLDHLSPGRGEPAALQDTLSLAGSGAWPIAIAATTGLYLVFCHFGAGITGSANEM